MLGPGGFDVPSLDEEDSLNLSLGLTWTPTDELNVTVDFYYIEIEDRIVLSGKFEALRREIPSFFGDEGSFGDEGMASLRQSRRRARVAIRSPAATTAASTASDHGDDDATLGAASYSMK